MTAGFLLTFIVSLLSVWEWVDACDSSYECWLSDSCAIVSSCMRKTTALREIFSGWTLKDASESLTRSDIVSSKDEGVIKPDDEYKDSFEIIDCSLYFFLP